MKKRSLYDHLRCLLTLTVLHPDPLQPKFQGSHFVGLQFIVLRQCCLHDPKFSQCKWHRIHGSKDEAQICTHTGRKRWSHMPKYILLDMWMVIHWQIEWRYYLGNQSWLQLRSTTKNQVVLHLESKSNPKKFKLLWPLNHEVHGASNPSRCCLPVHVQHKLAHNHGAWVLTTNLLLLISVLGVLWIHNLRLILNLIPTSGSFVNRQFEAPFAHHPHFWEFDEKTQSKAYFAVVCAGSGSAWPCYWQPRATYAYTWHPLSSCCCCMLICGCSKHVANTNRWSHAASCCIMLSNCILEFLKLQTTHHSNMFKSPNMQFLSLNCQNSWLMHHFNKNSNEGTAVHIPWVESRLQNSCT